MNNSAEPDFFASHAKILSFFFASLFGYFTILFYFIWNLFLFIFSEILSTEKYVLVLSELI